MLSLLFVIESLPFYRLKSEWTSRVLFLLTLAANLLVGLFNPGDADFSALGQYAQDQLQLLQVGTAYVEPALPPISAGNLIFIASVLMLNLFNLFIMLLYTGAYTAERLGQPDGSGIRAMLRALPKFVLLILVLAVPAILSSLLFWLPIIVLISGLCFAPMFYSQKRMGFSAGLRNSWSATRYKKFSIFVSFLYLSLLIELLTLVTTLLFRGAPGAEVWVGAFLTALVTLIRGRLLGVLFTFFMYQSDRLEGRMLSKADVMDLFAETLKPAPDDRFVRPGSGRNAE